MSNHIAACIFREAALLVHQEGCSMVVAIDRTVDRTVQTATAQAYALLERHLKTNLVALAEVGMTIDERYTTLRSCAEELERAA